MKDGGAITISSARRRSILLSACELPAVAAHSEQGDRGIDRFGHFTGLTRSRAHVECARQKTLCAMPLIIVVESEAVRRTLRRCGGYGTQGSEASILSSRPWYRTGSCSFLEGPFSR